MKIIINEDLCIEEINKIYSKYGKVTYKLIKTHSCVSPDTIKRRFGSLINAYKKAGIDKLNIGQRKMVTKEDITTELFRIQKEYGYVSKPLMEKYSSYSPKIVQRIFGSFSNAYSELNLNRHSSGRIPTDEELINEARRIYNEQGYLSYDLIDKFSNISTTCYKDRARKNNWNGIYYYRKQIGCEELKLDWCESPSAKCAIEKFTEAIKEKPIKEKTFDWLINKKTGKNLRIDAYYPKSKIAIEYNGPQHYLIDGRYTKSDYDLKYRKSLDEYKYNIIKANNINLIVIHFKDKVTNDYVNDKLKSIK